MRCVEIASTAVCFELFDKLLNADGLRFMCCCVNFGANPGVMLLFVQIFPNLEVCIYIYCLARLEKCLVLFVFNTLSVDMLISCTTDLKFSLPFFLFFRETRQ